MARLRRAAPDVLAAIFALSGALHLLRPSTYAALIPPVLPAPGAIIAASGIAELACAVALRRRVGWAAPVAAALLVAVFPGNIWFAVDPARSRSDLVTALAWLRLPLQAPLIWMALQARPIDKAGASRDTPNDR